MATTNPRDFLTEYQLQILGNFQEIIQVQDDQLCVDLLQQTGWNLEQAVNAFMQGGVTSSSPRQRSVPETPQPSNSRSSNNFLPVNSQELPVTSSSNSFTNREQVVRSGTEEGGGLLDLILYPIRWLFSARSLTLNPSRDAENFIDEYEASYGTTHVPFHRGSYQSAVGAAFQQNKFLLIYLHSPLHEDNDQFCQQVLGNSSLINLVTESMIVWGGRVWDSEAYALSTQLGVTAYPFLGLLVCQSTRSVQVTDRIQGNMEIEPLLSRLRNVTSVYSAIIERNRIEAERRAEAVRLREQQDREYQESIEAERQELERQRIEEEARIRAEEEKQQQEELAAAVELSKKLAHEDEIRKIRSVFEKYPEPAAGPDVATIRFQLPRAKKLTYRFHKDDKVERIVEYLKLQFDEEGDITRNFTMATTFPKMEITDYEKTIQETGLHPRGMLYVQDADV